MKYISKRCLSIVLLIAITFVFVVNLNIVLSNGIEVIVDNTDQEGFSMNGGWKPSVAAGAKYGKDTLTFDARTNASNNIWAKWTPDIAVAGVYDVYMFWNSSENRPKAAPIEINSVDGIDNSKTVNQTVGGGSWVLIGTYTLEEGRENYVKLMAGGGGIIVADAVKFVFKSAAGDNGAPKKYTSNIPDSVSETTYEGPYKLLAYLGIFDEYKDKSFELEKDITRAELVVMIVKMLGYDDIAIEASASKKFSDIPSDHWAKNYIYTAFQLNLIGGYSDGTFRPDDIIAIEQVLKIVLNILGYEYNAEAVGGYPTGYFVIAKEKRIMQNVTASLGDNLDLGDAIHILYNTLNAYPLKQESYGNKNIKRTVQNETLLYSIHNILRVKGRVTATGDTGINGESRIFQNEVEIDNVIYKAGNVDANPFLGYLVNAFVFENKSKETKTLLHIESQNGKNSFIEIETDDMQKITGDVKSKIIYEYIDNTDNSSLKKATVSETADVIYNGIADPHFVLSDLKPNMGRVVLLDYDSDQEYDVVFVTNYFNVVVDKVYPSTYKIIDKNNPNRKIELNPKSNEYSLSIKKDNKSVKFGVILEGDVISIAESKDTFNKKISVIVSSDKINGVVTEKGLNDGIETAKINDTDYKIDTTIVKPIKLSDDGIFFLDYTGRIVYLDVIVTEFQYGYLLEAAKPNGVANGLLMKIFNLDGEWKVYNTRISIEFNNIPKTSFETVYDDASVTSLSGMERKAIPQLIMFKLDGQGRISGIKTVGKTIDFVKRDGNLSLEYCSVNISFQSMIYFKEDTKILFISDKEEEYQFADRTALTNGKPYELQSYNEREYFMPEIVVINSTQSATTSVSAPLFFVDNVSMALNDEGAVVKKITGIERGNVVSKLVKESYDIGELRRGDIIRIGLDRHDQIAHHTKEFTFNLKDANKKYSGNFEARHEVVCGTVKGLKNDILLVDISKIAGTETLKGVNIVSSTINVYLYDENSDRLLIADKSEIEPGNIVFVRSSIVRVYEVVIFKYK